LLNQTDGLIINSKIIKVKIDIIKDKDVDNNLFLVFIILAFIHSNLILFQFHSLKTSLYIGFGISLSSSKKTNFIIPK
jgi:hypothetical protein